MTDITKDDLNKAIAELAFPNWFDWKNDLVIPDNKIKSFNLENWNDLMKLVVEHGISLRQWADKKWTSDSSTLISTTCINKDPQMALALCLYEVLKAKEQEA